ncbi:putative zinc ribbon protein [Escherichia coli]|uniref:putative zinc ribbon protein n=1 Tax=Escherichia coli TaxID=562 RepID=UPI003B67F59B
MRSDTTRNTIPNVPKRLQQWVPDALPVVRKTSWHCRQCHHDYYGEQYCTHCHTGRFSEEAVAG